MSRFTDTRRQRLHIANSGRLKLTYLSLGVLGVDHHPANLDDLGAVLGHVDAMLVTRGCDMDDAVLFELRRGRRLLLLRRRVRSRGGDGAPRVAGEGRWRSGWTSAGRGGRRVAAAAIGLWLGGRGHV